MIHVHRHDSYSQLDGVGTPAHAARIAAGLGHVALAQTNHGHMNGALAHRKACQKEGILPIIGSEVYFRPDRHVREKEWRYRRWHMILLVKNLVGWHNLIRITSESFASGYYQTNTIDWDLLERYHEGLICTTSCILGPLPFLVENGTDRHVDEWVKRAQGIFGDDLYFAIHPHDMDRQRAMNMEIVSIANRHGGSLVYEGDSHYPEEGWVDTQKVAILVGMNKTFEQAEAANQARVDRGEEVYELWHDGLHIMSELEVRERFAQYHPDLPDRVVDEAISATDEIAAKIEPYLYDRSLKMPRVGRRPDELRDVVLAWCREGLQRIGKEGDSVYEDRLRYEDEVITGRGAWPYIYVVADVVRWARSDAPLPPTREDPGTERKRPIRLNSGRGSSAASLICYLARITMIDPIGHRFKFERFLNPERKGMPDIDIDVASSGRGLLKEYVARKYGYESVADIVAQQHFQPRAALLNVTRTIIGYDSDAYRQAARLTHQSTGCIDPVHDTDLEQLREREPEIDSFAHSYPIAWEHARRLENAGDPSVLRLSKHAGAVAVLPGRVTDYMPTIRADEDEAGVRTAWAETPRVSVVDEIGVMKIDFLALRGMDQQQMIVDGIAAHDGLEVDLDYLPVMCDPYAIEDDVIEAFQQTLTLGVNQSESDGMRDFMRRAAPENVVDLAAINALYRPGPLGSGGHNRYVKRKRGDESYEMPEILRPVLGDTYSSLAFQEQVMELFEVLVGYSAGQADDIRKIIAKLYRDKGGLAAEKLAEHEQVFMAAATEKIGEVIASSLWQEILPYSGYCLSGDTVLIRGAAGRYSGQEVTLRELFEAWHSKTPVGKKYRSQGLTLLALDEDERIRPARAKAIWSNGVRDVWQVETATSRSLRATLNHRLLTAYGYRQVDDLRVGDQLVVMDRYEETSLTSSLSTRGIGKSYVGRGVPAGPNNPGWIDGRAVALREGRLAVRERSGNSCEFCGSDGGGGQHGLEFAHVRPLEALGGDYAQYHSAENVLRLCNSCHKGFDYEKGDRKRRWSRGIASGLDEIVSIEYVGAEEVFDLEMASREHNFLANGIVSHNSFNRAHAGSYMIQAYQDMWLKVRFPLQFYAVLLTLEAEKALAIAREARHFNVSLMPPDVNVSGPGFTVDYEARAIRFGLEGIKGIAGAASAQILDDRPYADMDDFVTRSSRKYSKVNKGARDVLERCGALDSLGGRDGWSAQERAEAEQQLLGFALTPGGILGNEAHFVSENASTEAEFAALAQGDRAVIGGTITEVRMTKVKRGRQSGRDMAMLKLSLDLDSYSVTCFPDVYDAHVGLCRVGQMVMVNGRRDDRGALIAAGMMDMHEFIEQMRAEEALAA